MKLNILAENSGRILAISYIPSTSCPLPQSALKCRTEIVPSEGQSIHEVDLPDELHHHVLKNTLAQEIFKYRVESRAEKSRLVMNSKVD